MVGLILLVGCANLAGLMLARNEHRRGEAAIRVALGVGRFRLLRLFLSETFLLAGSGSLAGLLVSVWLLQVVGRFVLPGGVSIGALDFEWSGSLVACGLVAAVATALLCGLMPGLQILRIEALPVLQGHPMGGRAGAGRSEAVAIVNESLARHLWPDRSPLGRRFTFNPLTADVQVVGVVRDGKYRGLREAGEFAVYLPLAQHRGLADWSGAIIGRAARDAGPLVPLLAQQVRAFDADLPISEASTLADRIAGLAMPQRMGASLLGALGGLALVLAILGVYGSVAYAVTRRTREVGIRIALGASSAAIVGTVLSRTLLHAGVGTAAGVGATFALTGLVEQFLFGVAPRDPATFVAVTGTIVLAILLAGLVPALRAARIAPAVALGEE